MHSRGPMHRGGSVFLLALAGGLVGCEAPGTAGTGAPPPTTVPDPGVPPPTMPPPTAPPPLYDAGALPPPVEDPTSCNTMPGADFDVDGFPNGSDCNDCSPQVNPGAFDAAGDGVDADCDGSDSLLNDCDAMLPMVPTAAQEAARAIGLCRFIQPTDSGWGVLDVRFTDARGVGLPASMNQVGILPRFGTVSPAQGMSMLALSSGVARAPDQPAYTTDCDEFGGPLDLGMPFPEGIPTSSPSCRGLGGLPGFPGLDSGVLFDSVALEVRIRVPSNATGFRFNSNFYTYEYPNYVCDTYNDFFAVMRRTGAGPFENIVYDNDGNLVSVNNSLLQVCTPGFHGGKSFACAEGRSALDGTGYDGTAECGAGEGGIFDPLDSDAGGATGWLRTLAPVVAGEEITLRFAIWDTGDSILDSLVLVDGFMWETAPIMTTVPETDPDPLI